ncbi:MAG: hypothetical protein LH660_08380 [Phormidesmis sp. CAN_BIN36]|nr:hypothetical protein [Phormidesmis sp. CAN_BIN36]
MSERQRKMFAAYPTRICGVLAISDRQYQETLTFWRLLYLLSNDPNFRQTLVA